MSELDSNPLQIEIGTDEVRPVAADFTPNAVNALGGTDTIASATATLADSYNQADASAALSGPPVLNGNLVELTIVGSALLNGHTYVLRTRGVFNSGKQLVIRTLVLVRE